ncbi:replicative DNA helicase [Moraxella sp. ZY210820]|uniref:replicative DNA helicase n=1 Tax=unclassified Moraxella TaxID=2685852 RepID=UPI002731E678|nr:replicative DNA helicase [Moraxella sp. ZY210820]WLF83085.1 replicative DNA helicase [Moraxella sp. ZY210820]
MSDTSPNSTKNQHNNNDLDDVTSNTLRNLRNPPHNLAMEQGILVALMTVADSFSKVSDILREDDFYASRHKYIFRAIQTLDNENEPYDSLLVHNWLLKQNLLQAAGGEEYLIQLMSEAPSSFYHLEAYAEKIKDFSTLRNMIRVSSDILQTAYETQGREVSEILDLAETQLFSIAEQYSNRQNSQGPQPISAVAAAMLDRLDELSRLEGDITGYSTGFIELDNYTSGMQAGDLIIVAARPSMGKTTFAMNLVESVLFTKDLPALVFSMEMPADSILMRMVSAYGKIHQGHLRSGKMNSDEWSRVTGTVLQLQEKKLFIDDSSALSPTDVRSRARRIAKEHGQIGVIMVDYLQLMKVPGMGDNRVGEISEISRSLKALAKEMKCPVIALSQLNRALENRPNKRPVMSDLRESGAIEQDADVIMFIYRDERYNPDSKDAGTAEIIIGKQRNGPIGTVRLAFEGVYTRFSNLSPEYYQQDEE